MPSQQPTVLFSIYQNNTWTSDTWLMRRSIQRPSILYWKLSDFFYLCQTSHEGNKCRTKAKELLRAFCPNIHTVISYFIRWERRLPSSGLLNTTTGFGSLVGIVFPKAIKTGIILLIDQVAAIIFVKDKAPLVPFHRITSQYS